MNVKKYKAVGYCLDCTGVDFAGCNDGVPWTIGVYDTKEEAEKAGHADTEFPSPWYYEIEEII